MCVALLIFGQFHVLVLETISAFTRIVGMPGQ